MGKLGGAADLEGWGSERGGCLRAFVCVCEREREREGYIDHVGEEIRGC